MVDVEWRRWCHGEPHGEEACQVGVAIVASSEKDAQAASGLMLEAGAGCIDGVGFREKIQARWVTGCLEA
jgi:hypothetical protein